MPVFDPDTRERLAPPTDVERLAPWVIHAANARMRGHLTAEEWERETDETRLHAAAAELPLPNSA